LTQRCESKEVFMQYCEKLWDEAMKKKLTIFFVENYGTFQFKSTKNMDQYIQNHCRICFDKDILVDPGKGVHAAMKSYYKYMVIIPNDLLLDKWQVVEDVDVEK